MSVVARIKRRPVLWVSALVLSGLLLLYCVADRIEISSVVISGQPDEDIFLVMRQNVFSDSNLYVFRGEEGVLLTRISSFDKDEYLKSVQWEAEHEQYVIEISRRHSSYVETQHVGRVQYNSEARGSKARGSTSKHSTFGSDGGDDDE